MSALPDLEVASRERFRQAAIDVRDRGVRFGRSDERKEIIAALIAAGMPDAARVVMKRTRPA